MNIAGVSLEIIIAIVVGVQALLRVVAEILTALGSKLNKPELSITAQYIGIAVFWIGKILGLFGIGTPTAVKAEIVAAAK